MQTFAFFGVWKSSEISLGNASLIL